MTQRSFRGKLASSEQRRIIVDDGRFTHGMKIISFQTFPVIASGQQLTSATLATQDNSSAELDADDNRQIGWSTTAFGATSGVHTQTTSIIDPSHIIVNDLYVRNNSATDEVNYIIIAEPITMSDDQAILALIKERSQDDL